jgi:hypothetical protein
MLVPPPIWIILTSLRTVITVSLYKMRERVSSSPLVHFCHQIISVYRKVEKERSFACSPIRIALA